MKNMPIIEEYLNQLKKTNDQVIKQVEAKHITIDELKKKFLDLSKVLKVDETQYTNLLYDIEILFNAVPESRFRTLLTKDFEELSKLDRDRFVSWLNGIKFNNTIEDDLKISFLCSLYDLELNFWTINATKKCAPNTRQDILLRVQYYQNLVEGFFSKTINIILYAMMAPSGNLELKYKDKKGKEQKIHVKSYEEISTKFLNDKLLLLQGKSTSKELIKIAKACNKDLRNAVAHQSFKLDEPNKRIIYRDGQLKFDDFINQAITLSNYEIILVECFQYYSMKCYFESMKLLK